MRALQAHSAEADGARIAKTPVRGVLAKLVPVGALGLSAALLVSVTVPASALVPTFTAAPPATTAAAVTAVEAGAQSVEVDDVDAVDAERGDYKIVVKPKPKPKPKPSPARLEVAAESAASAAPPAPAAPPAAASGTVVWPVDKRTVSDGFGPRVSPCAGCSSMHMGTDFTGGNGAPVYAIAAGTVTVSTMSGGYGQHVYLDSVVNGQKVRSLYSHLQAGSSPVVVGQYVEAGTVLGLIGATGNVTGPHLHHEITVNGTNVDPYAWLAANVG